MNVRHHASQHVRHLVLLEIRVVNTNKKNKYESEFQPIALLMGWNQYVRRNR